MLMAMRLEQELVFVAKAHRSIPPATLCLGIARVRIGHFLEVPMKPEHLLQSIYLGDRACKAVVIDSWKERVAIQIDVISRLKPGTTTWDYYTGADITDGWLIFSGVRRFLLEPGGPLPNDLVNGFSVRGLDSTEKPMYLFELSIGSVDSVGHSTEVLVRIEASRFHLEDPSRPGTEIME